MKTIFAVTFVFISFFAKSQTTDFLFVPNQNSLVVTYTSGYSVGMYFGGRYITSFPQPYTYTTPFSLLNRVGLIVGNDRLSIMGGVYGDYIGFYSNLKPDVWVKVNPVRILTDKDTIFDLSLGLNYSENINYGFGISIRY